MSYVGFVGYSSQDFDIKKANEIIDEIFENINSKDIIVGGATNLGINKLVYEKAIKLGIKTIGIMCSKGYEYELAKIDKLIVVGDNWGDESEEFLSSIEILYKIGGGKQSSEEFKKAKNMGIETYEYDL